MDYEFFMNKSQGDLSDSDIVLFKLEGNSSKLMRIFIDVKMTKKVP